MSPVGLELCLIDPIAKVEGDPAALRALSQSVGTLRWPSHLSAEAVAFVRDNLFAERLGDARAAHRVLFRGYRGVEGVGAVLAAERARFLAEKPFFPPEPPEALAVALDLDDFVAEFSTALAALRTADPRLDLVLLWLDAP